MCTIGNSNSFFNMAKSVCCYLLDVHHQPVVGSSPRTLRPQSLAPLSQALSPSTNAPLPTPRLPSCGTALPYCHPNRSYTASWPHPESLRWAGVPMVEGEALSTYLQEYSLTDHSQSSTAAKCDLLPAAMPFRINLVSSNSTFKRKVRPGVRVSGIR